MNIFHWKQETVCEISYILADGKVVNDDDKDLFDIMATSPNSTYVTINISIEHVTLNLLYVYLSLYETNSICRRNTCFILPNNLRHTSTQYSCLHRIIV